MVACRAAAGLKRWRARSRDLAQETFRAARLAFDRRQEASGHADPPDVRVRLSRGRHRALPRAARARHDPGGSGALGGDPGVGADDRPLGARRGPLRPPPDRRDDGRAHDRRRAALCLRLDLPASRPRRVHRDDLGDELRGRGVPDGRAGDPSTDRAARAAHVALLHLCLRREHRAGRRVALRRRGRGVRRGRPHRRGRLPSAVRPLRRDRSLEPSDLPEPHRTGRSIARRRPAAFHRRASVGRNGRSPCCALRRRRVRGRPGRAVARGVLPGSSACCSSS